MTEPDVTLTDYAVAVECALLAVWLARREGRDPTLRVGWTVFFAAAGLAALLGGTVHGFFPHPETRVGRILWPLSLLALGGTALAAWVLGAKLLFAPRAARWIATLAGLQFGLYGIWLFAISDDFRVAVVEYAPATVFLLVACTVAAVRRSCCGPLWAALGLLLTLVAALLQQIGVGLHPRAFDHNASYHLLQAVAFLLVHAGARSTLTLAPAAGPRRLALQPRPPNGAPSC